MISVRECVCPDTLGYVLQSKTIQGRTVKEHQMNKKEGTLLQKAENIVNALEFHGCLTRRMRKAPHDENSAIVG